MAAKKSVTLAEQLRGFPFFQIVLISLARLADPITFTALFPYVYFMIRDFGIAKSEHELSKYVGYLSSSFALFEFLFTVQFGVQAERFGRKPVLMFGLVAMAICSIMFGFARTYWEAIFWRSLMGATNGFCAVVRTVVGEIAEEKRHQALAFSSLPLCWNIGVVIGPLIPALSLRKRAVPAAVGAIAGSASEFNVRDTIPYKIASRVVPEQALGGLVDQYPYCLPNLIIAAFLLVSTVIFAFFFEETHPKLKFSRDIGLELGDAIRKAVGLTPPHRDWQSEVMASLDSEALVLEEDTPETYGAIGNETEAIEDVDHDDDSTRDGLMTRRESRTLVEYYSSRTNSFAAPESRSNLKSLLLPQIFHTLSSSFVISSHCLIFDEFLPVFLSAKVARVDPADPTSPLLSKFPFRIIGGLGYDTSQIGSLLAFTGFVGIAVVMVLFPIVDAKYSSISVYRVILLAFPLAYFFLPYLIFTAPPNKFSDDSTLTVFTVYVFFLLKTFGQSIAFPEIMMLVHRVSPPENRAFINGVLMSTTALSRFFGPFIFGAVMSWANAHNAGWVTWWTLAFIATLGWFQTFLIRSPDDEQDEQDDEEP